MVNPVRRTMDTKTDLANRLFFRLYQCANMLHKTGSRAVEEEGLTTQQWAVLGALSREKSISAGSQNFAFPPANSFNGRLSQLRPPAASEPERIRVIVTSSNQAFTASTVDPSSASQQVSEGGFSWDR